MTRPATRASRDSSIMRTILARKGYYGQNGIYAIRAPARLTELCGLVDGPAWEIKLAKWLLRRCSASIRDEYGIVSPTKAVYQVLEDGLDLAQG